MKMDRNELMKRIGSIEQIGGVRDFTFNDGKAKGIRAIEVNTGVFCFTILVDRCLDIAQAFYKTTPIAWISKTGITSPYLYEKDGLSWLRGFYGGLLTTCGLKNIGNDYKDQGLHGRIANIPAEKVSVSAEWVGDDYIMQVSGEMRESVVFGENLVLKRKITAKMFDNKIYVEDTLVNEGFNTEDVALCYHCNFGYPLVSENSIITNVPADISTMLPPMHNLPEECVGVEKTGGVETIGIENGSIGAYITYNRDTLPDFLIWKKFAESDYVVGLEPRTTNYGGKDVDINNAYVKLPAFDELKTDLVIEVKDL